MAMPLYAKMYKVTGDRKYMDYAMKAYDGVETNVEMVFSTLRQGYGIEMLTMFPLIKKLTVILLLESW